MNEVSYENQEQPAETGCFKIIRIAFSAVNTIVFCFSIVVFTMGIWIITSKWYMSLIREKDGYVTYVESTFLILVGTISAAVSFLGYFAAWQDLKLMNLVYCSVMLILSILILVGGITMIEYKKQVLPHLKESMAKSIPNYRVKTFVTKAWDALQEDFKCCGVKTSNFTAGWQAWSKLNPKMFNSNHLVPISCCKKSDTQVQILKCYSQPDSSNMHIEDCSLKVRNKIKQVAPVTGGIAIMFGLCQLAGAFFACILVIKT